jgi:hypothetical protein
VHGKLSVFERPKDLFFLKHFPETGNSKVQRKKITAKAIAQQIIRETGEN